MAGCFAGMAMFATAATGWGQSTEAAAAATAGTPSHSLVDELKFDVKLVARNNLHNWLVLMGVIVAAVAIGRVVVSRRYCSAWRRSAAGEAAAGKPTRKDFHGLASPANLAIFTLGLSVGMARDW